MATAFGATDFIVANPDRENLVLTKENRRFIWYERKAACRI